MTGEAIIGANIFRDLFASVRDIVGGRSATYEKGSPRRVSWRSSEMRQKAVGARGQRGRRRGPRLRSARAGQRHAHGLGQWHCGRLLTQTVIVTR